MSRIVWVISFSLVVFLPFQNCGQPMSALTQSQILESSDNPDQIYLAEDETFLSKTFSVSLWENVPEFSLYLVKKVNPENQNTKTILRLSGFVGSKIFYDLENDTFQDYSLFVPRIYDVNPDTGRSSEIYLQNDSGTKLLSVSVQMTPPSFNLNWEVSLPESVTPLDLLESQRLVSGNIGSIRLGKIEVTWMGEENPIAQIVSSCSNTEHLENNVCVSNIRSCPIANGTGQQIWQNNMWSSQCAINSCNNGYVLTNGSCLVATTTPTCSSTQHLENNVCVSNTRSCLVTDGTGQQTWQNNMWSNCAVNSCNNGYVLTNGSCLVATTTPTCSSTQHLENNVCVSNTRSCPVQNGSGQQTWINNMWSTTCSAVTCNMGFALLGGACMATTINPVCSPGQYLHNNVCVNEGVVCADPKVNIVGRASRLQGVTGVYYSPQSGITRLNGNRVGNIVYNTATKLRLINNELLAYGQGIYLLSTSYREVISWNLSQGLLNPAKRVELSPRVENFEASDVSGAAQNGLDHYISGTIRDRDGKQFPGYWKNGIYQPLPPPPGKSTHYTNGMAITQNGDIYIIGGDYFWKNGVIQSLLSGTTGLFAEANDIFAYGNDIYMAGIYIAAAGEKPKAVYWKNGQRIELTDGSSSFSATSVKVLKGIVYVGAVEGASAPYSFHYWKGPQKFNFTQSTSYTFLNSRVDLEVMGENVYIMGSVGSNGLQGYFKNGSFTQVPDVTNEVNTPVKPQLQDMLLTCP